VNRNHEHSEAPQVAPAERFQDQLVGAALDEQQLLDGAQQLTPVKSQLLGEKLELLALVAAERVLKTFGPSRHR